MKKIISLIVLFLFFDFTEWAMAQQQNSKTAQQHNSITAKQPLKKRIPRRKKRLKYVAPPQKELKVEEMPLVLPISAEAVTAFAENNLEEAVRILRTEEPSSKSLHLIAETQRILSYKKNKKPPKLDRHQFFQNIGIAYHNLFLFLRVNGIVSETFYKQALKFYSKALNTKAISEKTEALLLKVAIMAAYGEIEKAQKIFSKLETEILTDTSRGLEYIACYYAAIGNVEATVEMMAQAYEKNPEQTMLWLAIGDDFFRIKDDAQFKGFLRSILHHPQ